MDLDPRLERQHVLQAMETIRREGVPARARSTKYDVIHPDGTAFPPKLVLSLAVKAATGRTLSRRDFKGGEPTNGPLSDLGFTIIEREFEQPPRPTPLDVLTNDQLGRVFEVANAGGMRWSSAQGCLVIIADHTKGLYDDRWEGNVLHHTGMGRIGDQTLSGQNKRLADQPETDTPVHLFEVFHQGEYIYVGEVRLVGKPHRERQLDEPDRNAALRFLHDALPSLETELPGIRNEGLLSDHELARGARLRQDWTTAQARATPVLGATSMDLLRRLGFGVEKADGVTHLLRTGSRDRAVAVLLDAGETPEGATPRFQNLSPVSWALAMADQRNLPWVVVVQGDRVRLYPVELGVGVGRRGRTETWIELRTGLMRQDQAALLWLIFSADALKPNGTLEELLDSSKRFASDLAVRLRERIYDRVIPGLATGIAKARGLKSFTADELRLTYAMALTVLFRLLFIAYAEDRDLLPFTTNEAYRHRALKTKALELIDCSEDTPRHMPAGLGDGVFAFWDVALADILAEWDDLSDPAKLQPQVRLLNKQVAAFIRAHPPHDLDGDRVAKALDILEAPWPRREEALLREQFRDRSGSAVGRSARLVEWILATGLERFEPPAPLPPVSDSDVRLVCWMAVEAEA